ncbi:MAG: hypothetical protein RBU30_12595 [Polyangia bacterium]|jgi:hypothetical protein|nr:hypothetical protein [Polyangia bacterium]
MKLSNWFKGIALVAALSTFGTATMSCAWILHPERRNAGRTSGRLDTVPLILDILWFIPGIIPGVVCLVVDFVTGAIYVQNLGSSPLKADGKVAVKVPPVGAPTHMALRLLGPAGQVLDQASVLVQPGDAEQKLVVDVAKGQELAKAPGGLQLEITGMTGGPVRIPVATR